MAKRNRRAHSRENRDDLIHIADDMPEFAIRLGLATPTKLSSEVVSYLRDFLDYSQFELDQALQTPGGTARWEYEQVCPGFEATVQILALELRVLALTDAFDEHYDVEKGLLGRLFHLGVLSREEVTRALRRLAEPMLAKLPENLEQVSA